MLICSTRAITDQWIDSSRVVAVALPLAVWVLAQRSRSRADAGVRAPVEPASDIAPAAPTPA
jgi:hypothetical protein